MGTMVRNERIRLSANYLNSIAIGLCLTGALIPMITFLNSDWIASGALGTAADIKKAIMSGIDAAASFSLSFAVHWMARRKLAALEDD